MALDAVVIRFPLNAEGRIFDRRWDVGYKHCMASVAFNGKGRSVEKICRKFIGARTRSIFSY